MISRVGRLARFALALIVMLGAAELRAQGSMFGTYYMVPLSHPDFENGIDGTVAGLVKSTLGPNGLPVASAFGKTYAGASGPITDIDASTDELLWWTPGARGGGKTVIYEKSEVNPLPYFNGSMYPDAYGHDFTFQRTARYTATFVMAGPGAMGFDLGADDDAFLFIDGTLVADLGGVHGVAYAPYTVTGLSAGVHTLDLFYADRHTSGAALYFDPKIELFPADPGVVPEPSTVVLVASGLLGLGGAVRRRRTR